MTLKESGTGKRRMRGVYEGSGSIFSDGCLSYIRMMVFFEEGKAGHAEKKVNLCRDR